MIKICLFCNKEFNAIRNRIKYCSHGCAQRRSWSLREKRIKGNKIIIQNKIALIYPTNHHLPIIIDANMVNIASQYTWHIHKTGSLLYPRTRLKKGVTIRLHRLLMIINKKRLMIDHKNRNLLDNRLCNLRICTSSENRHNSCGRKNNKNTSKYKGVYRHSQTKNWVAQCRGIHLGCFKNEEDAASAYNKKAQELYKEFAFLNSIQDTGIKTSKSGLL